MRPDHPDRVEAQKQFDNLMVDDGERFFFQPCFSVVWDTAIAAFALGESDARAGEARCSKCADWLLTKEVRRKGDWSVKRPEDGAVRLVLRIRQRVLSRYRRHRHGAAGAQATARLPTPPRSRPANSAP